jgi:hypothetical protein
VINWVSLCFSSILSASIVATYNFIAPTCTTTIIILGPYALNVEFEIKFPHFMDTLRERFSLNLLLFGGKINWFGPKNSAIKRALNLENQE